MFYLDLVGVFLSFGHLIWWESLLCLVGYLCQVGVLRYAEVIRSQ